VSTVARHRAVGLLLLGVLFAGTPGCSIRRWAAGKLGDALASGGTSYASDDDPELVGDALPFALKTIEGLLETTPRHKGLLLAAASGFTQYAYVYLATEADYVEDADLARATHLRDRAMGLYRRAFEYGLRGLEVDHPGVRQALADGASAALAGMKKDDVPLLYWTSAAWSLMISLDKTDAVMAVNLPAAESLMHRALELDPGYGDGVIHDYYISYEGGRVGAAGGSIDRARGAGEGARAGQGAAGSPYLAFAESVSVGSRTGRVHRPARCRARGEPTPHRSTDWRTWWRSGARAGCSHGSTPCSWNSTIEIGGFSHTGVRSALHSNLSSSPSRPRVSPRPLRLRRIPSWSRWRPCSGGLELEQVAAGDGAEVAAGLRRKGRPQAYAGAWQGTMPMSSARYASERSTRDCSRPRASPTSSVRCWRFRFPCSTPTMTRSTGFWTR
jgi:hypothetical protein